MLTIVKYNASKEQDMSKRIMQCIHRIDIISSNFQLITDIKSFTIVNSRCIITKNMNNISKKKNKENNNNDNKNIILSKAVNQNLSRKLQTPMEEEVVRL